MWEWIKKLFGFKKQESINHERHESKIITKAQVENSQNTAKKSRSNEVLNENIDTGILDEDTLMSILPDNESMTISKPIEKKVISQKNVGKPVKRKQEPVVTEMNVTTTIERTSTETVYLTKHHYEQTSKAEILEKLHSLYPNETKVSINETVQSAFDIIADTLLKKEEVAIFNFGKLEPQHKESRDGINPLTGQDLVIPAANSVKFKASKHLKEAMSKQKWTGLYQVEKTIEKTVIDEYDFETEISTKTEANDFLNKIEEKYKEDLNLDEIIDADETFEIEDSNQRSTKAKNHAQLSISERSKIDGSHKIEEERYELQKHANALRTHAKNNNFSNALIDVNLRDMTKKELIVYMKKIQKAQAKIS